MTTVLYPPSRVARTTEVLAADVAAGAAHTLPGGLSYRLGAGKYMQLYVRGLLWQPGADAASGDYAETSTTSITPFRTLYAGDAVEYVVLSPGAAP